MIKWARHSLTRPTFGRLTETEIREIVIFKVRRVTEISTGIWRVIDRFGE